MQVSALQGLGDEGGDPTDVSEAREALGLGSLHRTRARTPYEAMAWAVFDDAVQAVLHGSFMDCSRVCECFHWIFYDEEPGVFSFHTTVEGVGLDPLVVQWALKKILLEKNRWLERAWCLEKGFSQPVRHPRIPFPSAQKTRRRGVRQRGRVPRLTPALACAE